VVELARQQLTAGADLSAAELLRAAEHLSFAALEATNQPAEVSSGLEGAITAELLHLLTRAADHPGGKRPAGARAVAHPVAALLPPLIEEARAAYQARTFRVALELARAAEALARVELTGPARLTASARSRRLA
jgi:hypothetical protein